MEKKVKLLERTAAVFDLPPDVVGLPRLELTGRGELRMTNHKGILAYGTEEILVSGGAILYRVRGSELELRAMNSDELLITGQLLAVELE